MAGTSYLGVPPPWVDRAREEWEQKQVQADLYVVGAPSSGTRLFARLMGESGLNVIHDHSHGHVDRPLLKVVCIERDRDAVVASCLARTDSPVFVALTTQVEAEAFVDERQARVRGMYPTRPFASFEALVADRDTELNRIADALGLPHWQATEVVTDENSKYLVQRKIEK